jgi:hypothetical protein
MTASLNKPEINKCGTHGENGDFLKARDNLRDLSVDGKIILKYNSKKLDVRMVTGRDWFRTVQCRKLRVPEIGKLLTS